jgi:NAD(P)H-hydrate epimerase
VVALGPGLTDDPRALAFARAVALRCTRPLVLDADGLNAFAGRVDELAGAAAPRVLTPHPGEAARLLSVTTAEVERDRAGAVGELAARSGATCLLKGAGTLVALGSQRAVNSTGNAGMATGGSGDVLTGVIAALLAQGMQPFDAATLGAWLHGRAGDLAAAALGQHALMASDILDHLAPAFRERTPERVPATPVA